MTPPPILSFRDVHHRFARGPEVLEAIDLEVSAGEVVSFLGPSGCGKTTLLRLAAGLLSPTKGSLQFDEARPQEKRREMAFIFQHATLLPWLTAQGNVEIPLRLRCLPRAERQRLARERLTLVGLEEQAAYYPRELSGGMQMRVSLARALTLSPRLMLLDEPFGALDAITRNHLNEQLLDLLELAGTTALFVTHSVQEAVFLSHRVVVMASNPGRVHTILDIPLPTRRDAVLREGAAFQQLVAEAAHCLREATTTAA